MLWVMPGAFISNPITLTALSFVIPGCRVAASPESITTVREYGFRARAKGRVPE